MIAIIRIHSKEMIEPVWDAVVREHHSIQSNLKDKCHLLYLTKRIGYHDEISLFVDVPDQLNLSELIIDHLGKIKGIDNFVVHHLLRPKFYPLPEDTRNLKRYTINLKVTPAYLGGVYKKLIDPNIPDGLKKVYFAFTFHHPEDSIQFSMLAESDDILRKYVTGVIDRLPGVIHTRVYPIERTKPFVTYETWQAYARTNPDSLDWSHLKGHRK